MLQSLMQNDGKNESAASRDGAMDVNLHYLMKKCRNKPKMQD